MAVSADDVQRVARKYLNPNSLQVVAVGDADKIKPILEQYGKVEVFDANGAPLQAPPSLERRHTAATLLSLVSNALLQIYFGRDPIE